MTLPPVIDPRRAMRAALTSRVRPDLVTAGEELGDQPAADEPAAPEMATHILPFAVGTRPAAATTTVGFLEVKWVARVAVDPPKYSPRARRRPGARHGSRVRGIASSRFWGAPRWTAVQTARRGTGRAEGSRESRALSRGCAWPTSIPRSCAPRCGPRRFRIFGWIGGCQKVARDLQSPVRFKSTLGTRPFRTRSHASDPRRWSGRP